MKKNLICLIAGAAVLPIFANFEVECSIFKSGKFSNAVICPVNATTAIDKFDLTVAKTAIQKLDQYAITVKNNGIRKVNLRIRLKSAPLPMNGDFFDGYQMWEKVGKSIIPDTHRHNFPAAIYQSSGNTTLLGFSPEVISSRFERGLLLENNQVSIYFDNFIVLMPKETLKFNFIGGTIKNTGNYTEGIEAIHQTFPEFFRPYAGTDSRIYGVGGYFFSADEFRNEQAEEARRMGFDWEWYYNCYQKAGDFYPDKEFFDEKLGYKTEKAHAACDTPGTIQDWYDYNFKRINFAEKTSATLYYYLQQYCNTDLLQKNYPDSKWVDAKGRNGSRSHGWAEEGFADYAWPGKDSSFGSAIRKDLKKLWEKLPISGFALDCAIGDVPYYGEYAKNEPGRAFDKDGKTFVVEGAALAYNMDYTHQFKRANGATATSVINEAYCYLPIFHCDAMIHEMPPFDRSDVIAPRRFMLGQKPMYFWKGFRIDALLRWTELSDSEIKTGLSGVIDYVIMASLRFGVVPAIFYERGFEDMVKFRDLIVPLQKAGWHAAPLAQVENFKYADPYAINAPFWISRYGTKNNTAIVVSSVDVAPTSGRLIIESGKMQLPLSVWASDDGKITVNQVEPERTIVDFTLKAHEPLILRVVKTVKAPGIYKVEKEKLPPSYQIKYENIDADGLDFGSSKKINGAIYADKNEFEALGITAVQLQHYFEYYFSRKIHPYQRLWGMQGRFLTNLILAINSPEQPIKEKIVFVLGEKSRKKFFPLEKNIKDVILVKNVENIIYIGFFPGKLSEEALVAVYLKELDKRFPYHGGITEAWGLPGRLYGKNFKK